MPEIVKVSKEDVKNLVVPLPPIDDQRRIAAEIERQLAAVEKARKAAAEQLNTINAIPTAILRQAFSGQLREDMGGFGCVGVECLKKK